MWTADTFFHCTVGFSAIRFSAGVLSNTCDLLESKMDNNAAEMCTKLDSENVVQIEMNTHGTQYSFYGVAIGVIVMVNWKTGV